MKQFEGQESGVGRIQEALPVELLASPPWGLQHRCQSHSVQAPHQPNLSHHQGPTL